MKLRTRIIWINCILFLIASFVTELVIWCITADSKREAAVLRGYEEYHEMFSYLSDNYERQFKEDGHNLSVYMEYMLKSRNNDYDVCYELQNDKEGSESYREIYNGTILTIGQLKKYSYQNVKEAQTEYPVHYTIETIKSRRYVIIRGSMYNNEFELYHIRDITYVKDELIELAFIMVLVAAVVAVMAIIILNMILKREFKALHNLSKSAELIAEGEYSHRVEMTRKDEIGILGDNFNKMAEAVEKRTENLTLFMGNLTHELKTPMTAISGYAQTLLSANLSEEEKQEALMYIYKECGRIERMSEKMLKLLEIDSSMDMEFKEVTAGELFDDVEVICSAILENKSITLTIREQGEVFVTDRDLMTDVLVNLVDNAIKASEKGQTIILMAEGQTIYVQDFGKGIPEEELENILEPFYMIDKSRSRKSGGAGLGLALTALILEKTNVVLNIESEVGKGSRFILQFV